MNAFTFDTLAAYLSAKASGGAIYAALSAGGNSPVSASVVSYITGTGETIIDAKNVIVDEHYGGVGSSSKTDTSIRARAVSAFNF